MRRTRRSIKKTLPEDSSDEEDFKKPKLEFNSNDSTNRNQKAPSVTLKENKITNIQNASDDSSSESDLESYLKPANEIDLNSSFFAIPDDQTVKSFDAIEKDIFSNVKQLSDSESDDEVFDECSETKPSEKAEVQASTSKLNFQQLHDYTRKLEEAKRHIDNYISKQEMTKKKNENVTKADEQKLDILNMLAMGEATTKSPSTSLQKESLHLNDSDTFSDSEKEDWEEVKGHDIEQEKSIKKDIEITLELPDHMRKKKGKDLLAAMKRRLNRIKKENQVLVHKVHLLCWIAHGNYVNKVLNTTTVLAAALSLVPSQHSYPKERTDLKYLQQIVSWYTEKIKLVNKPWPTNIQLEEFLLEQIKEKMAKHKKAFVYIFICILRALGIQCRLVLSFRVEPLRPPNSELHSLSTKNETDKEKKMLKAELHVNCDNELKKERLKQNTGDLTPKSAIKRNEKESPSDKNYIRKKETKSSEKSDKIINNDAEKLVKKKAGKKNGSIKENEINRDEKEREKDELPDIASFSKNSKIKIARSQSSEKIETSNKHITNDDNLNVKVRSKSTGGTTKSLHENKQNSLDFKQNVSAKLKSKSTFNVVETKHKKGKNQQKELNSINRNVIESKQDNTNSSNTRLRSLRLRSGSTVTKKEPESISQVDGANDTDNDTVEDNTKIKPKLSKLREESKSICPRNHPKRLRKVISTYKEQTSDSEEELFQSSASRKLNKDVIKDPDPNPKRSKTIQSKSSIKEKTKQLEKEESSPIRKNIDVRNDIIKLVKGAVANQKANERAKLVKKERKSMQDSEDDSDYFPEPIKKKVYDSDDEFKSKSNIKVKQRIQWKKENNKKVLSSDGEQESKKKGNDVWVEVFVEAEEKWISVDVFKGQVHCVQELYSRASKPVSYIVAWNNNDTIKDITSRYCKDWHTVTRKLRVDPNWWNSTLKPFMGKKTVRDKEEDEELAQMQLEKPLPTTISEYKNHPLYVLQRHLLKFEAIYPPDAVPLGYVRGEPVYSRYCVYTLHSRELWMKEAKVVKPGEKPYKIVKARPKYDKLSGKIITDLPLEIFGIWQVEDYDPPTAENGIVPRNAYGNVELFKECMLPKGTVRLRLPGLNKVARKLNIDCADAVVGFDFHAGWNHPVYDGYVVCKENEEVLVAAWHAEQEEQERKEQEKIEKRVYGNWRRLIRGLLIRERLKAKYNFGTTSDAQETSKGKRKVEGPNVEKKRSKVSSSRESDSD